MAHRYLDEIALPISGVQLNRPPHHIHDHASHITQWMNLLGQPKRAFLTPGQAQAGTGWALVKHLAPSLGQWRGICHVPT